jgi:predicted TIM-barrel fold metal-dependent hydrolase
MLRFDCHAHVYERVYAVGKPRYLPKTTAPLKDWQAQLQARGVEGGVIVQISFFGTDNSELLNALRTTGTERFRGVAVVPLEAGEENLQMLRAEGIRGVRWNLVAGAPLPDPALPSVRDFLKRLNRTGLHLQIQLEGPLLGPYLRALCPLVERIVVDHFGLPACPSPRDEPWIGALAELASSSDLWVKFSAPYRSPVDVQPHAEAILDIIGAGRVVWGSDWPWTNHEGKHGYDDTLRWADRWLGQADLPDVEHASRQLYGFEA